MPEQTWSGEFSREQVSRRMLKSAAETWNAQESAAEDFDPIVQLLFEACAVEFEKAAGEIGKSQHRMLQQLARLFHPGTFDVYPAYGVIQVRSAEPRALLASDDQFLFSPAENNLMQQNRGECYFSPCCSLPIVDAEVVCLATPRVFSMVRHGIPAIADRCSVQTDPSLNQMLWVGLELSSELTALDGMSFFLNWRGEADREQWYPYLPYVQCWIGDELLETTAGPGVINETLPDGMEPGLHGASNPEREIMEIFGRHYISVTDTNKTEAIRRSRQLYPKIFDGLFGKKSLQQIKEPLVWLSLRFPAVVPPRAIDTLLVAVNAVPVMNRKLNRVNFKLGSAANIIPLRTEDNFLSVKAIYGSGGSAIPLFSVAENGKNAPESFSLRYGVNRFDERDAKAVLVNVMDLLREESSFFSSLGEDFLLQHIRELNQVLSRIEEKIKMGGKGQSPFPYLIINSTNPGSTVQVEYWSSNGSAANKIPAGSTLLAYKTGAVSADNVFFITPTFGGKDKLSDGEKIDQYRQLLLSRNRIVTLEDLRLFIHNEIGNAAKKIAVRAGFVAGSDPGSGFLRCHHISVYAQAGVLEQEEWDQLFRKLELKLGKLSAAHIICRFELRLI